MPGVAVCKRGESNNHDDDSDPEAEDAHGERGVLRVGSGDFDTEAARTREQCADVGHDGRVVHRVGCERRARGAESLVRSVGKCGRMGL